MNYFQNATLGFDKVTQDHRDLWDAAIEACIENVQCDIDSGEYDNDWVDMAESFIADIDRCKADGAAESNDDASKILSR